MFYFFTFSINIVYSIFYFFTFSINIVYSIYLTGQHVFISPSIGIYLGMHTNQNFDREGDLHLKTFCFFFSFFLQSFTFYWAYFQYKNSQKIIIKIGNSYHGVAKCSWGTFCSGFFTRISKHFCAYFPLSWSTLIRVSLEISCPPTKFEYKWCQYW